MKLTNLNFLILFGILNSHATLALADGGPLPLSMLAHAGRTSISSGLSGEKSSPTFGVNAIVHGPQNSSSDTLGGIQGFFLFDFASTKSKTSTDSKFPFAIDQTITLGETALVPTVCALARYDVQACVGFGYILVNVKDDYNTQTYGSTRADFRVGHYLSSGIVGGVEVHTYSVEQRVADVRSSFSVISYQAGLGYHF